MAAPCGRLDGIEAHLDPIAGERLEQETRLLPAPEESIAVRGGLRLGVKSDLQTGFKPSNSLRKPGIPALLSNALPTSRAARRRWICRYPVDGTKRTHVPERDLFKTCVLGVQYGTGAASLVNRIGKPASYAADLLRLRRQTYQSFWAWSDGVESHAMLLNRLHTVFGWTVRTGTDANPRSLRNFPCQANGAEMLRLACCLALERGVSVVAPIHDALLVEGLEWEIEDAVAETRESMAEASAIILDGFRLRSDAKVVRWPDRYLDDRGREFWARVMALLPAESEADLPAELVGYGDYLRGDVGLFHLGPDHRVKEWLQTRLGAKSVATNPGLLS